MRRSPFIGAIICAAVAGGVAIGAMLLRYQHSYHEAHRPDPASMGLSAQDGENLKTNAPSNAPAGVFLGKDKLLFVNFGTSDPALQSYMRAVMDGSYDRTAKGRAIFLKVCAACHQPDGSGKEGVAPPLAGSEWVLASNGDRLVRIVLNGMSGPVQVKGHAWSLAMPPLKENFKDDEIAVVLTYIRSQVGGNKAGAVTPESVAAARKEVHPGPETAAELLMPKPAE